MKARFTGTCLIGRRGRVAHSCATGRSHCVTLMIERQTDARSSARNCPFNIHGMAVEVVVYVYGTHLLNQSAMRRLLQGTARFGS